MKTRVNLQYFVNDCRFVSGTALLSSKFRLFFSKALLIFNCARTPPSLLEPYWPTSTSTKLYLASHIARRTILNVPL